MNSQARPLINKVWALCSILRDGGITYQDYLTELSWLLYLRFSNIGSSKIEDREVRQIWDLLLVTPPTKLLETYTHLLSSLGKSADPAISTIFADAKTRITDPHVLAILILSIDKIDWQEMSTQALGDIYEGILERNAQEQKSGAGQYFTPRSVVELMVRAVSPKLGEIVQDPAAGTGGFLVSAAAYARQVGKKSPSPDAEAAEPSYFGVELVPGALRLCLMNLSLHGVPAKVVLGNTLDVAGMSLPSPDIILTNPPFGSRRGADRVARPDLTYPTSNKQLTFLQHVYRALREGGRAAIIVPDGVLFDGGVARNIRQEMLHLCNVHTILRLPVGLFYAQAVKTNVLFLKKSHAATGAQRDATRRTWVYDARTGISARTQAAKTATVFADFELLHSMSQAERTSVAKHHPRINSFSRSELREHNDRLDLPLGSTIDSESPEGRDPMKYLYSIKVALTEALELVEQLEADFDYTGPDHES